MRLSPLIMVTLARDSHGELTEVQQQGLASVGQVMEPEAQETHHCFTVSNHA
jgi:hypothetical protein